MKRALVLSGGGSRGAFQAGVWQYLCERHWVPDIICGTSVGAINAAGIVSGMNHQMLRSLWTHRSRQQMYRVNGLKFLAKMAAGKQLPSLFDTRQIQQMVADHVDLGAIHSSSTRLVLSAVNVLTGHPHFFSNKEIRLEHILASSAMPVLFPRQEIDGIPFWDGGTMANIPLQPALDFGAGEIIVVLLTPVGHTPQPFPQTVRGALEHVFEQFLFSSFHAVMRSGGLFENGSGAPQREYRHKNNVSDIGKGPPNVITLAPSKMLGFRSLIRFSPAQAQKLMEEGYKTAHMSLKSFI